MKKLLSVMLSVLLLVACVPLGTVSVSAATSGTTGDCRWALDGTHLTISGNGAMEDYSNKYVNGTYRTKAPWGWEITSVTVEGGVTTIGEMAFYGCESLTSVTIGDSVTTIGWLAFFDCTSLTSVTMGDNVTTIGDRAFVDCTSLTSVTMSDSVTTIGEGAFEGCTSLTSVTMGDGVTTIGEGAFEGCASLGSIAIPRSVTAIGTDAFLRCGLKSVYIFDLAAWCRISFADLTSNPLWCAERLYVNGTEVKHLIIPPGVTSISSYAFTQCSITDLTIGNNVQTIGEEAFYGCNNLARVTIDDSVKTIGDSAFIYCDSLASVSIGDGVTSIGESAFNSCKSLTSITIPGNVKTLGGSLFRFCESLSTVVLEEGIVSIGSGIFYDCAKLKTVNFPNSISSMEGSIFMHCSALNSVKLPENITTIGSGTFYGCEALTSVIIPDKVTTIKSEAFYRCCNLSSISLGAKLATIEYYAFSECTGLKHVYYEGNETQRRQIFINSNNSPLTSATWHYEQCIHRYDHACDPDCNKCGHIRNVPGHSYKNTCDEYCDRCYSFREDAHIYTDACDSSCNICGSMRLAPHHYDNACDQICNACKQARTVPPHIYDNACDKTCNVCDAVRTVQSHIYSNACDKTCNVCGFVRTVNDHTYTDNCDSSCNECNFLRTAPHFYDNGCDAVCNGCLTTRQVPGHVYTNAADLSCNECKFTRSTFGVPTAPCATHVAATFVSLEAQNGYEYSMDGTSWQKSNVFAGLKPNTTYSFYQRVAAKGGYPASVCSTALTITTPKTPTYTVSKPTLVCVTQTMVQLEKVNNLEYSMDGKTWQNSATFISLRRNTAYTFYQRVRETATTAAGPISIGLTVTTLDKTACLNTPSAPDIVFTGSSKVTLRETDGYEYKMNNGSWQSSPEFVGLEADNTYTFYQRIKETDTTKASATSKGTTVTTVNYGLSTTACHLLLRTYIEEKGTTQSNGRKAVAFWSGNYYYKLQLSDNGVFCSMEHYVKQSSLETEAVVAFSLFPDVRDIPITMLRVVYYNGSKIGTYEGTSSIDRATYDTDMDIPVDGNFEVGSQMYDLFNGEFKMLLLQVTLFAMEELNMNPYYLGFFELKNPTFEKNFCDNATDYHVGKQVLKNQYAATCEYDGYSGDYVCDHCGITSQYGKTIPDKGGHVYSGACDTDCNTCGWVKEVVHTYSDACDESCNVCGAIRTGAHTYDTICDAHCNECNAERKPPHVYDNSDDLFCNACGYERPPYTPGDLDGDDVVTDADAVHLLFYTFFPEDYALNQDCDFDGDGTVNDADAVYLLFYTFFPEDYPVV